MPAPAQLPMVAYAVIVIIPLLFLVAYYMMYSRIGRAGLTGQLTRQSGS